jgi:fatty-acyl-CoA synthase
MTPSYAHGASAAPLAAETIADVFARVAERHENRSALVSRAQGIRYTYGELRVVVERAVCALRVLGVKPGDRVALWTANRAESLIVAYAVARAGAILVNLNSRQTPVEVVRAVHHSGAVALIAGHPPSARAGASSLDETAFGLRERGELALVDLDGRAAPPWTPWPDVVARAATAGEPERPAQFDDTASLMYTSGTTGTPKGAMLAHHSLVNSAMRIADRLRYSPEDRVCVAVPLYHTFGYVLGALAALTRGCTVILPSPMFDASACLDAVEEEQCSSLLGVPAMFTALLQHRSFGAGRVASLRTGIMAGAPCPAPLVHSVMSTLHVPEITICYGMTEAGTLCQSTPDDPTDLRASTVGLVHPHVECRVVEPRSGRTVPRGVAGELWARGYCVMSGYWTDAQPSDSGLEPGGWIKTGDLAIMLENGYVRIIGRLKDVIVSAGQNIYPSEIEDVLRTHQKVFDAAVVGIPDAIYGEAGCAWIQLQIGQVLTADEVREFCRDRLAAYKVPRRVTFADELPRTATGKVEKYKLGPWSGTPPGLARTDGS